MLAVPRHRIIVISEDLASPWDEGIKKFAWSVGRALESEREVRLINVDRTGVGPTEGIVQAQASRTFSGSGLRRQIRAFDPDVVIYVPSPSATVSSFLRAFWLRRHAPRAAHGMVALIPRRHGSAVRPLIGGTAPDVVFVPSYKSLLHLSDLEIPGALVPIGVDLETFRRAREGEKAELRRRYAVPQDDYVYLHVGHLSRKRNLTALASLASVKGACVIVVGSTSTPEDRALRNELEAAGMRVIREVVVIDELYRLSDCYVFPVIDDEGCVEVPLSVLEALASGLPVLARPFGGLRDHLPPGEDLRYWDTEEELTAHAGAVRGNGGIEARDMSEFAWEQVARAMVRVLEEKVEL